MTNAESGIAVYGVTWCLDCKRAKQFLGEQRIPFHDDPRVSAGTMTNARQGAAPLAARYL